MKKEMKSVSKSVINSESKQRRSDMHINISGIYELEIMIS